MRIVVSPAIQTDHDRLTGLVAAGFAGVDAVGVELHLERARPRKAVFVGRAYPELPSRPRTHDSARYLVRLVLPSVARNRGYPVTYRYRGLSTAPWITVQDWRERLVALAAHEAYHVHQFREGLRRSEVQAERWALQRLLNWRAEPASVVALEPEPEPAFVGAEADRPNTTQLTLFGVA